MSKLREAAQAVIDRWESPNWVHDSIHTSELIFALREALREDALAEMQALTESEYRENTLVRLTETHQQLGAELGETENVRLYVRADAYEYNMWGELELIGTLDGTYAGRWTLAVLKENWSTAWPDGTAIYVRRIKR
jgi:hypothetical protein